MEFLDLGFGVIQEFRIQIFTGVRLCRRYREIFAILLQAKREKTENNIL